MSTITIDEFAEQLQQWSELRSVQFPFMFPLKGGWEAWVQADFAAYLLAQDSTLDVLREQAIFTNPNQRVDMLFNDQSPVADKIALEIKCQSFENKNRFIPGMSSDIAKLAQANIRASYQGCHTACLGIFFELSAEDWLVANDFVLLFQDEQVGCAIKILN